MPIERRDPRGERERLLVPGSPRPRIDRSGRLVPPVAIPPSAPAELRLITAPQFYVLAVPDVVGGVLSTHDRQVLGAAHLLAGAAGAVVVLASDDAEPLGSFGADRVLPCPRPAAYDPDGQAQRVMAARAALGPRHIVFPETADGGDVARRVAVLSGETLFAAAEALTPASAVRACAAGRSEERGPPGALITIAPDRIAAYRGPPAEAARLPPLPLIVGNPVDAHVTPADPTTLSLTEAAFVIAAGNGVTDLAAFADLVRALGGTPGASRVLCDAGRMPRDRQVGASGTVLQADCYMALGISGAPQHLAGIAGVRHVIAVNTDLHAAMVARAGLAIIADAQAVMRALLARLAA